MCGRPRPACGSWSPGPTENSCARPPGPARMAVPGGTGSRRWRTSWDSTTSRTRPRTSRAPRPPRDHHHTDDTHHTDEPNDTASCLYWSCRFGVHRLGCSGPAHARCVAGLCSTSPELGAITSARCTSSRGGNPHLRGFSWPNHLDRHPFTSPSDARFEYGDEFGALITPRTRAMRCKPIGARYLCDIGRLVGSAPVGSDWGASPDRRSALQAQLCTHMFEK